MSEVSGRIILVCGGIGYHSERMVDAMRRLELAGIDVVFGIAEQCNELENAFNDVAETMLFSALKASEVAAQYNEFNFKRERDYPTLREGIRRKAITYPNKNNKRKL